MFRTVPPQSRQNGGVSDPPPPRIDTHWALDRNPFKAPPGSPVLLLRVGCQFRRTFDQPKSRRLTSSAEPACPKKGLATHQHLAASVGALPQICVRSSSR